MCIFYLLGYVYEPTAMIKSLTTIVHIFTCLCYKLHVNRYLLIQVVQ